jgi:CDP-glucose 4,6-dehydratase
VEVVVKPAQEFWRGRRVLLTGHSGFKGSWLAVWLRHLEADIRGLSLAPETEPSLYRLLNGDHDENWLDIRDLQALRSSVRDYQPDIVFHLAAQALVQNSYDDPVATYQTNVMGTVNLMEAVRYVSSVRAVVIVTSDKCYENEHNKQRHPESDPMGGRDPYSSSKGCAELVVDAYRSSYFAGSQQCRIATARAGNVIGGGDWAPRRLVPDILRAFADGQPALIRRPASIRPWQHVLEPLNGYIRLAEVLASSEGSSFEGAWNFGPPDEDCRPVAQIADLLARLWGKGASWDAGGDLGSPEADILRIDASKAGAMLDWRSVLDLEEALAWTVQWYEAYMRGEDVEPLMKSQIDRYAALAVQGPV